MVLLYVSGARHIVQDGSEITKKLKMTLDPPKPCHGVCYVALRTGPRTLCIMGSIQLEAPLKTPEVGCLFPRGSWGCCLYARLSSLGDPFRVLAATLPCCVLRSDLLWVPHIHHSRTCEDILMLLASSSTELKPRRDGVRAVQSTMAVQFGTTERPLWTTEQRLNQTGEKGASP